MFERSVEPADCAIGVGVPLSRREMLRDLASPHKDFASLFRREHVPGAPPDLVWDFYAPRAQVVEQVLRDVNKMGRRRSWLRKGVGVTIATGLSLARLRELLSRHHAVTLLTHLAIRQRVEPAEVLDPDAILDRCRTPGRGPVEEQIRLRLAHTHLAAMNSREALQRGVAEILTQVIRAAECDRQAGSCGAPLTRIDLEEVLSPWLSDAPVLELADGLVTWRQMLSAIPESFDGVLDLSLCRSVAIGETIKRRRPACLVVINRGSADLRFRAMFYRSVIRSLQAKPRPFTEAVLEMHGALLEELCEP